MTNGTKPILVTPKNYPAPIKQKTVLDKRRSRISSPEREKRNSRERLHFQSYTCKIGKMTSQVSEQGERYFNRSLVEGQIRGDGNLVPYQAVRGWGLEEGIREFCNLVMDFPSLKSCCGLVK